MAERNDVERVGNFEAAAQVELTATIRAVVYEMLASGDLDELLDKALERALRRRAEILKRDVDLMKSRSRGGQVEDGKPHNKKTTRREIERWVKRYSDAYLRYHKTENGTRLPGISQAEREQALHWINGTFVEAANWLREHGVNEWDLVYNPETKVHTLPDSWSEEP